ncbi:nitrate reductase associated protein [Aerosakkonema funiforme]|uniref:Nitrate reductase associated protein n=1 Tax=Aerosakkonema funiforme FACHB-1375 TaxID=2949571 RepID=A0A926ZIE5_9CYAN|nr:nitrate reductase associated protein [Aerosakkonema funiforme]MBD2183187.1 nitrate reductase associated protein [Aerosakkonema funiforme FACHB-1375]
MFFEFESDFVDALRCIPMQVRYKLDTCGVKLKLNEWNHFTKEERELLVDRPCTTAAEIQAYREMLHLLIKERMGTSATDLPVEENPAWMDTAKVPVTVREKAQELDVAITSEQWANLLPLQRFALIKLSRSNHENSNFLPALKEFNLV